MAVCKEREMTVVAYHGTDRMDFIRFDITEARIYNVRPHSGTRAAAKSCIVFLCKKSC